MTDNKPKPFNIHFRIPAKKSELIIKTSNIKDKNKFFVSLLEDYFAGKLDSSKSDAAELNHLKKVDLKLKIWDKLKSGGYSLDQLSEILDGKGLPHPEHKTFHSTSESDNSDPIIPTKPAPKPLTLGKTLTHKNNKILQEDGTLRCRLCNRRFDMRAFDFEQLDDYRVHFESTHRLLTDDERTELMELYD